MKIPSSESKEMQIEVINIIYMKIQGGGKRKISSQNSKFIYD